MLPTLSFIPSIGPTEWIIILVVALLLFGRRLPEVGRSLGKGIVEFKRGLKGIEDDIDEAVERGGNRPHVQTLPPQPASPMIQPPQNAQGQDVRVSRADAVE